MVNLLARANVSRETVISEHPLYILQDEIETDHKTFQTAFLEIH